MGFFQKLLRFFAKQFAIAPFIIYIIIINITLKNTFYVPSSISFIVILGTDNYTKPSLRILVEKFCNWHLQVQKFNFSIQILPWVFFECLIRLSRRKNTFGQILHANSPPSWDLMCLVRLRFTVKTLSHTVHLNIFIISNKNTRT
jgi:hypothetical protein